MLTIVGLIVAVTSLVISLASLNQLGAWTSLSQLGVWGWIQLAAPFGALLGTIIVVVTNRQLERVKSEYVLANSRLNAELARNNAAAAAVLNAQLAAIAEVYAVADFAMSLLSPLEATGIPSPSWPKAVKKMDTVAPKALVVGNKDFEMSWKAFRQNSDDFMLQTAGLAPAQVKALWAQERDAITASMNEMSEIFRRAFTLPS